MISNTPKGLKVSLPDLLVATMMMTRIMTMTMTPKMMTTKMTAGQ